MITKITNIDNNKLKPIKYYEYFSNELFSTLLKKGFTGIIHNKEDSNALFIHKVGGSFRKKYIRCSNIDNLKINDIVYNIIQGYFDDTVQNISFYDDNIEQKLFTSCEIYVLPPTNIGKDKLNSINLDFPEVIIKDKIKYNTKSLISRAFFSIFNRNKSWLIT